MHKEFNLTGENLSIFYITQHKLIRKIRDKALYLNLPIMERKWDRVNYKLLKQDKYDFVLDKITKGLCDEDIINDFGFSKSLIYRVRKESKL